MSEKSQFEFQDHVGSLLGLSVNIIPRSLSSLSVLQPGADAGKDLGQ